MQPHLLSLQFVALGIILIMCYVIFSRSCIVGDLMTTVWLVQFHGNWQKSLTSKWCKSFSFLSCICWIACLSLHVNNLILYVHASRDVSNNDLCGTIPTSGPFEHIPLSKYDLQTPCKFTIKYWFSCFPPSALSAYSSYFREREPLAWSHAIMTTLN